MPASRMSNSHTKSVSWFTIIGALAALTHYIVAVSFEHFEFLTAAHANIAGFAAAFPVSYFGHRNFSFAGNDSSHGHAFPRFLSVAILGFLANQILVLNALQYTKLPFWFVLGVVMVLVAVSTYLLSKFWAFKGTK
jgi:putative flippase GtrA